MSDKLPEKIFIQDFKTLTVWKKSIELADLIYKVTKKFPNDEKYMMVSQMIRCTTSIGANIAEGYGQLYSLKEINFFNTALGSTSELRHWLEQAYRQNYITKKKFDILEEKSQIVIKMIIGYIKNIKKSLKK